MLRSPILVDIETNLEYSLSRLPDSIEKKTVFIRIKPE